MAELGYQPNAIACSLSSTRTNTIGMIVPNISNRYFAELTLAVEDAAMERMALPEAVVLARALVKELEVRWPMSRPTTWTRTPATRSC
jgi:hypothetical protein